MRTLSTWLALFAVAAAAWPAAPRAAGQQRSQRQQQAEDARRRGAESRILDNLFRPQRGARLTGEQQEKLQALRDQHGPQLVSMLRQLQQQVNNVYTAEQRAARSKAMAEAREAGQRGAEARRAVDEAVKLSDQQRRQLADLRRQREQLLAPIQQQVAAVLGRQQGAQRRRPPTHANVQYGPHERNVLDFWQAESERPTPVLLSIHGGGFRGGNKSVSPGLLQQCLDSGISVAAITYRFSQDAIAPASFTDSARALQYIRSQAKDWNIDSSRIAATGGSAGAGISLWLGFHDDMADPDSDDPVLRQSTRLTCMYVNNGQTSYDPRFIRQLFPGTDTYRHSALAQLFDVNLTQLDDLPAEKYRLFEEVSALPHLSKDDPPVVLSYSRPLEAEVTNQSIGIHHAKFGVALKEKMDPLGIRCEVIATNKNLSGGPAVSTFDFIKEQFAKE